MVFESTYAALTFDCYGTLIDWRAGLLAALARVAPGADPDAGRLLDEREGAENRIEAGAYLPYRRVVAASVRTAAGRQGIDLDDEQVAAIAASVADWPVFADAPEALEVLGAGRRLAIVSNVESRDVRRSIDRLGVRFAEVVTAEDVRSYKPSPAHFEEVLRRLGLPAGQVLHVAQSLHHDIRPAAALGLDAVWINRRGETAPADVTFRAQYPDLAALAEDLGPAV